MKGKDLKINIKLLNFKKIYAKLLNYRLNKSSLVDSVRFYTIAI